MVWTLIGNGGRFFVSYVLQHIAFLDLMNIIDVICCSRNLNPK